MRVSFLDSVADLDDAADRTRHVSHDIQETPIRINLDNTLIENCGGLEAHATSHLFTLKNFSGELAVANRTSCSVRLRVAMRGLLTGEVPPFHDSLESLTLAGGDDINKLAYLIVSWSEVVADWQEALRGARELSKVRLGWQIILN